MPIAVAWILREADAAMPPAPAEQLRCFIHHFLSRVLAINHPDDWRHRLMLREMLHPTSASDVLIREAIRPKFERLQQILRQFCPEADERKLNALAFSRDRPVPALPDGPADRRAVDRAGGV